MTSSEDSNPPTPNPSPSGGGGSGGSGGLTVQTTNQVAAVKPNIGDLDRDGKPWTGGEPKDKNWKSTKSLRPHSGYAYRNSVDFRQYGARLKGIEPKFCFKTTPAAEDMSLTAFSAEVKRHLVQHGMDSVFWIEDMQGQLHDIVTSHALYTIDNVLAGLLAYDKKFDDYDRATTTVVR